MMATIKISKKWDETQQKYIPDQFEIEGDGDIILSSEFVNDAYPEYLRRQGHAYVIGPYILELLYQNGDGTEIYHNSNVPPNSYVCRLLTDPKQIEAALNMPWESMDR